MTRATQFHEIFEERVAKLEGRRDTARLRWYVWTQQLARGETPCFATEARNTCRHTGCPWRMQCLARKAEWKR